MAPKKKEITATVTENDTHAELLALLKSKLPGCFEREPAAAYTSNLNVLAQEIINLLN